MLTRFRFRRSVRRPLLVAVAVAGVLLGRPPAAEASFAAMLTHVIAAVNTAIDTWEKHTRILEDHLDHVGGLTQSFSSLNSAFTTVLQSRGLSNRFRLIDVARAEYLAPNCFRESWVPCTDFNEFEEEAGRELPWRIGSGLTHIARDYSDWERLIGDGWDGVSPLIDGAPPGALFDFAQMLIDRNLVDEFDTLVERGRRHYERGRHLSRAKQHDVATGRAAARQFLYHDSGAAGGYTPLRPAGDMTNCPTAGATTLLGQAYLADCEDPDGSMPLGGTTTTNQHLSDVERRTLEANMAIVSATAEVSALALRLNRALEGLELRSAALIEADQQAARRTRRIRLRMSGNCDSIAYAERCDRGESVGDVATVLAAQIAIGG